MNDIDKINEELRNYKLYKIQRALTREQEFTLLNKDLNKIRNNEVANYIVIVINIASVFLFVYNVYTSWTDYTYIMENTILMVVNFILVILLSLYLSYVFFNYNRKLKLHIKTSENAIAYFKTEGENLKSTYESYVDNYLNSKN